MQISYLLQENLSYPYVQNVDKFFCPANHNDHYVGYTLQEQHSLQDYLLSMTIKLNVCFQTYSRPNGNSLNPPMPVSNFLRIPREKENSTLESTPPAAGGSSSQCTNTGIDSSGFSLLSTRCFIALNHAQDAVFRPQKKLSDGQTKFSITGSGTCWHRSLSLNSENYFSGPEQPYPWFHERIRRKNTILRLKSCFSLCLDISP